MKQFSVLLVVFLLSIGIKAQETKSVSLNLYGGYIFSDKVDYNGSYGYVEDGFEYGAGLEFFLNTKNSIEVKYQRIDTQFPLYNPQGNQINEEDDKGVLNYILLVGTHYLEISSPAKIMPYFGVGIGAGVVETPQNGSDTNYAWEIKTGAKIKTGSKVSINLQVYLQSISGAVGNSYYLTSYNIVEATNYVTTYQFGIGAVLSVNFKKQLKM